MPLDSRNDIFVSYAHDDNGIAEGASIPLGWVTALAANLNEGPNVFKKRYFIDHQLRPGDNFSAELLTQVEHCSVLLILLSQNYIESKWCGQELDHFVRTHAKDPEKPADVYVVELFPYEAFTDVPPNIQRLRKRLIHAKFWHQARDKSAPSLAGYPSPPDSGPEGSRHYWSALSDLRFALDSRLRALRGERTPEPQPIEPATLRCGPRFPEEQLGTVLLADTTEDLEAQRTAVRIALEPENIVVLPEGDYVGLSPQEFEAAIAGDLARADLFVQLLSPTVGRMSKGFEAPLPQLQHRRAKAAGVPVTQWCERLPAPGQIEQREHAQLFETEFIRATNLSTFKTAVIERLRAEKERRDRSNVPAEPSQQAHPQSRKLIFVDDLGGEPPLSDRLLAIIKGQQFSVRRLPAGAPLGNNGIDIMELLRPCRAGITIYADGANRAAAGSRIFYFLNRVAEAGLPLARWGVYLRQGTVASEFGIESDEVVPVDEHGLADFLRGL